MWTVTPWSKALLNTLTVPQIVSRFPAFYRTQMFTTVFTTASHFSLSWGRWILFTSSAIYNLHFNIILPSMITSHKWSLSNRFPHQNIVRTYTLSHMCYMTRPSHLLWFDSPNIIWWGIQSLKFFIMYSSPLSCYLVPLRPKYIPEHPILGHPYSMYFLDFRDQFSLPYKTTDKISSANFNIHISWQKTLRQNLR